MIEDAGSYTGFCVVRSEPFADRQLFSVLTSTDLIKGTAVYSRHVTEIPEVLRMVAAFLEETSSRAHQPP